MTFSESDAARVVIGSRRSRLARAQAHWVGERLSAACPDIQVEFLALSTAGDRDLSTPLPDIGVKGLFTADLETALSDGRIDLVVHSLKDLPTDAPGDETLAAIPVREDPRDVLVLRQGLHDGDRPLDQLPPGLCIGTSSVRRESQIRRSIGGVTVKPLRGNVETRLGKIGPGALDGAVLAAAGLRRLGLWPDGARVLDPPAWLPAAGQGALALQCRHGDERVRSYAVHLHDLSTAAAITAERQFLARLGGGCHVPVAAFAHVSGEGLTLAGSVFPEDVSAPAITGTVDGSVGAARELGISLAERLLAEGAQESG